MKTFTDIFTWKKPELRTRVFFTLFSILFHILFVYFFYTARFEIREIESRDTVIEIRPLIAEKTFLPSIPMPGPQARGALKADAKSRPSGSAKTIPPGTGAPANGRTLPPAAGAETPGQVPAPGEIASIQKQPLSAPFNPSRYLKPETLDEIFRRMEQEKVRPEVPIIAEAPAGKTDGADNADSGIVTDIDTKAYFNSRGFDISFWAQKVAARIFENWFIPAELMPGMESDGEVGIAVSIKKSGQVITQKIQRPSNLQLLDQAALNALIISSPFPALPRAYANDTLEAYFLFNYHFPVSRPRQSWEKEPPPLKLPINSLISSLGLVKGTLFAGSVLPQNLVLGIEVSQKVYYRLMSEDRSVGGGILQEGFNFIEIPAAGLFKDSGIHKYTLDMRVGEAGETMQSLSFLLDIRCDLQSNSGLVREEVRRAGYGLALFVQNRLVAFHKKSIQFRSLLPQDKSRKERRLDVMGRRADDPLQFMGEQRPQAVVPIIPMAVLAYKYLLKPALKKKVEEIVKVKPALFDRLSGTFLVKDAGGVESPLDVTVTIQLASASGGSGPF
ncbi:MAG: TonB C-terminal domain-containing protein [Candidatus Aminicenantes bacterium]|nr:TonB C-terminal domain-containing protein [Candidatus Aminicenantes bacterium]